MNAVRNILVVIDPAAARHSALAKATLLAEKYKATLQLFACGAPPLTNLIEDLAGPLRARGLEVTWRAGLLDHVKHAGADLIVKDTHHHTFPRRTVFSNTDWELIRGVGASLLLTKPASWSRLPGILAAVGPAHEHDDAAQLDRRILDGAAELARCLDGRLHAMHAYLCNAAVTAPVMAAPVMASSISQTGMSAVRAVKLKALTELASEYSLPPANIHLEMGGVRASICSVASEVHADVVVMGAVSSNGLTRALIGSTAEEVLERLPCDALIVKS